MRLSSTRLLNIARQTLDGLAAIHEAGLIHRDISPNNIMISAGPGGEERATIIDFGIAKETGIESSLTDDHVFLGKIRYASPEQLKNDPGEPLDGRADLYSFGVVLYQMLSGSVPFDASSAGQLISLQLFTPPPPLPPAVADARPQAVLSRSLAKKRDARYASASALRAALESAAAPLPVPPPRKRRPRKALLVAAWVVLALVLIEAAVLLVLRFRPPAVVMVRVYSDVLRVGEGMRVERSEVESELTDRAYRKSSAPAIGEYSSGSDVLDVGLRKDAGRVRIHFRDGAVEWIRDLDAGRPRESVLLEPEPLATIEYEPKRKTATLAPVRAQVAWFADFVRRQFLESPLQGPE